MEFLSRFYTSRRFCVQPNTTLGDAFSCKGTGQVLSFRKRESFKGGADFSRRTPHLLGRSSAVSVSGTDTHCELGGLPGAQGGELAFSGSGGHLTAWSLPAPPQMEIISSRNPPSTKETLGMNELSREKMAKKVLKPLTLSV